MVSNYDNKILEVLAEVGEAGMSVHKMARHVFNASNSLFEPIEFEDVHRYVQQYVLRCSRGADALLQNVGQRGIYRLNPNSAQSQQLMLMFRDEDETESEDEKTSGDDMSLSLF